MKKKISGYRKRCVVDVEVFIVPISNEFNGFASFCFYFSPFKSHFFLLFPLSNSEEGWRTWWLVFASLHTSSILHPLIFKVVNGLLNSSFKIYNQRDSSPIHRYKYRVRSSHENEGCEFTDGEKEWWTMIEWVHRDSQPDKMNDCRNFCLPLHQNKVTSHAYSFKVETCLCSAKKKEEKMLNVSFISRKVFNIYKRSWNLKNWDKRDLKNYQNKT